MQKKRPRFVKKTEDRGVLGLKTVRCEAKKLGELAEIQPAKVSELPNSGKLGFAKKKWSHGC